MGLTLESGTQNFGLQMLGSTVEVGFRISRFILADLGSDNLLFGLPL